MPFVFRKMVVYLDEDTMKLARNTAGTCVMCCRGYCGKNADLAEGLSAAFSFCVWLFIIIDIHLYLIIRNFI